MRMRCPAEPAAPGKEHVRGMDIDYLWQRAQFLGSLTS